MPPQIDRDADPQPINDEYPTENDPKGETKVTPLGELLDGRRYRVKTFKVPGRGETLFSISTDVARMVGYRDSYFLFQKHINLYRFTVDEKIKFDLINDGYLPVSFKTRHAYLITARSAFKEFGARIIVNGRHVIDDYYEQEAIDNGFVSGTLVNANSNNDDIRNGNNLLLNSAIQETETSWVYDHALKCRQFDTSLLYDRQLLLKKKTRDIYTNSTLVAQLTQPTRSKITKIGSNVGILFDTTVKHSPISTGLASVPNHIFQGLVDDETLTAILGQQKAENSF